MFSLEISLILVALLSTILGGKTAKEMLAAVKVVEIVKLLGIVVKPLIVVKIAALVPGEGDLFESKRPC